MTEHRFFLHGELDLGSAPKVRRALREAIRGRTAHLVVDCADLNFVDSTGIALLLEAHKELEADGRHMLICNVQPGPRRVFEILGLTDLLRYDREPGLIG